MTRVTRKRGASSASSAGVEPLHIIVIIEVDVTCMQLTLPIAVNLANSLKEKESALLQIEVGMRHVCKCVFHQFMNQNLH